MITGQMIEDAVSAVEFHLFRNTTVIACALTLRNGHVVVGLAYCAKGTTFDPKLGSEFARQDANQKVAEVLACEQRGPILPVAQDMFAE